MQYTSLLNLPHIRLTLERSLLILNSQIRHDTTCAYVLVITSSVWGIKLSLLLPRSQILIALMKEQCAAQSHRSLVQVSFGPQSVLDFYR